MAEKYRGLGFDIEKSDRKGNIPIFLYGCTQYKNGVKTPNGKLFTSTDEIAKYCDPDQENSRQLYFICLCTRESLKTEIEEAII